MRRDLGAAIKQRDGTAVSALRAALAALDNAGAVAVEDTPATASSAHIAGASAQGSTERPRRALTDAETVAVIHDEVSQRVDTADRLGQSEYAQQLRAEARVLARYLPES